MKYSVAAGLVCLALGTPAFAQAPAGVPSLDWTPWRHLPVQDNGRYKPLDTLARETLRTLSNRGSFADPDTGEKLDPVALYLAMLLEWPGWDAPPATGSPGMIEHPHLVKPDKWDQAPLLRVDHLPLREALGMPGDEKYISPAALSRARIRDPRTGEEMLLLVWADRVGRNAARSPTPLERKGLELASNLRAYYAHRSGKAFEVLPVPASTSQAWLSLAGLVRAKLDDASDPSGQLRAARQQFQQAQAAYLSASAQDFNEAAEAFLTTLEDLGPQLGPYPDTATIDLEVAYNHWVPFRFAWGFTVLALSCTLLSMGSRRNWFYAAGLTAFVLGLLAMCAGFAMRIAISGRAPVTNMYESVVYLALGTALFGLVFELVYRKRFILVAAAVISTIALVLADNCPAVLDPGLHPLPPALASNFWLVTHVMSITLSYAAFALALGIGDVTLGYFLLRSKNARAMDALSMFTYRSLKVGVLLLATGTILGAIWADYAWGRFWGWDAKEVWALVTLLGYLAVLHARHVGWVRQRGLAACSVVCFALVVMAWYGVNFVLGSGLHSYGAGGGGQSYVFGGAAVQFLYVAAALAISAGRRAAGEAAAPRLLKLADHRPAADLHTGGMAGATRSVPQRSVA